MVEQLKSLADTIVFLENTWNFYVVAAVEDASGVGSDTVAWGSPAGIE